MPYWKDADHDDCLRLDAITKIFEHRPNLLIFLFHTEKPQLRASSEKLLYEAGVFSSGEYLLVQLALDIWDGSGGAKFMDVYQKLDTCWYDSLLEGIEIATGIPIK